MAEPVFEQYEMTDFKDRNKYSLAVSLDLKKVTVNHERYNNLLKTPQGLLDFESKANKVFSSFIFIEILSNLRERRILSSG